MKMQWGWLVLILGLGVLYSGDRVAAHGWRARAVHAPRVVIVQPYAGPLYYHPRFGAANPYSLRFSAPYPHHYGRWDLYFNMHGAPGF
jgi:hypothetical protein